MATTTEVISSLQARGVTLHPEGGNLRIKGISRITAKEKAAIKAHKAAILRALHQQDATDTTPAVAASCAVTEPLGLCPTCGSNHYWLSPTGWTCWGCSVPPPNATTLCIPKSQPTPATPSYADLQDEVATLIEGGMTPWNAWQQAQAQEGKP